MAQKDDGRKCALIFFLGGRGGLGRLLGRLLVLFLGLFGGLGGSVLDGLVVFVAGTLFVRFPGRELA